MTPPPGDYEQRVGADGTPIVEGECAGCGHPIAPNEPSVIRYSVDGAHRGGLFHERCEPKGAEWFGVGEETGAPDL